MTDKLRFADYMRAGAVPLPQEQRAHSAPPAAEPLLPPYTDRETSEYDMRGQYRKNGVAESMFRQMLKSSPRQLDLHGMLCEQAHHTLENFLADALGRGERIVEIIHGRGLHSQPGGGVLRGKTRYWLCCCRYVLAYCEPRGNQGAVVVLLSRRKKRA